MLLLLLDVAFAVGCCWMLLLHVVFALGCCVVDVVVAVGCCFCGWTAIAVVSEFVVFAVVFFLNLLLMLFWDC